MVYDMKENLKLSVETTLVNACLCKDLLSLSSLVESHLVSEAEVMSDILDKIKKRGRIDSTRAAHLLLRRDPLPLKVFLSYRHFLFLPL